MGAPTSSNQQQSGGKGTVTGDTTSSAQPSGKGNVTNSATSAQPSMGQPSQNTPMAPVQANQSNQYPNTVGGWDNASLGGQANSSGGKGGKGQSNQSAWQPFNAKWTPPDTSNLNTTAISNPAAMAQDFSGSGK